MGQYFQLVNTDKKERVALPGGMKDIERVTNGVAMGIIGYLLFEGPCDGGRFTGMAAERIGDDDPRIDEYIEREKENTINTDRTSTFYDAETGEWRRDQIKRIIGAGEPISETFEYAGRWAGDSIRLVGDYAESGLYDAGKGRVVAQLDNGSMVGWEGWHPDRVEPGGRSPSGAGQQVRMFDEKAEPGDTIRVVSSVDVSDQFAEFVRYEETEWTNIDDELFDEFIEFVGEDWINNNGWGDLTA